MSRPCPAEGCDRPAPGDATICGACQADLRRALDTVAWLAGELDVTLSGQHSRTGAGSAEAEDDPTPAVLHIGRLGYNQRASEAAYVLRTALVGWVRVMSEGWTAPHGPACRTCVHPSCVLVTGPADTPTSMAAWLSAGLSRLARHPAAEEAHGEITAAVRAAQRAVDRPPGTVYAGPCRQCATALYAKPGATYVRCRECGESHDIADRREWMISQCEDLLGSSAYVAMVCRGLGVQISESTVRMWVKRRKLQPRTWSEPRGDDAREEGRRRPLYRVGDVIDVALGKVEQFSA